MNPRSIARREYSGRAVTLGSVLLCADYLDLHVGQQGRQRPQGGQHRRYDGDRPADDHPGGEGDLHEHLVLLVADYDAAYVALFYELLGPIDQVARGDLDLLGKGMFVLLGGVVHPSGLFAHGCPPSFSSSGSSDCRDACSSGPPLLVVSTGFRKPTISGAVFPSGSSSPLYCGGFGRNQRRRVRAACSPASSGGACRLTGEPSGTITRSAPGSIEKRNGASKATGSPSTPARTTSPRTPVSRRSDVQWRKAGRNSIAPSSVPAISCSSSSSVPASSTEICKIPVSKRWRWPSLSHRVNSYGLFETTTAKTLSSGASSGGVIRRARRSLGSEKAVWSFDCATPSLSCL